MRSLLVPLGSRGPIYDEEVGIYQSGTAEVGVAIGDLTPVRIDANGMTVDGSVTADSFNIGGIASSISLNSSQFGAVPDDPTFDNADAITAWLQYAATHNLKATGHGTFYVTTVDTVLPGPLFVDGEHQLTFWGMGDYPGTSTPVPGTVLTISGGASRYGVQWVNATVNTSEREFIEAAPSGTGITFKLMDKLTVLNSVFLAGAGYLDGFGDSGMSISQVAYALINGCYFQGHPDKGIYVTGGPDVGPTDDYGDTIVTNNFFYRCNLAAAATRQSRRFIFSNNEVVECLLGAGCSEAGAGAAEVPPGHEVIITDNHFTKTGSRVFQIHDGRGSVMSGNVITDWGQDYEGSPATVQYAADLRGTVNAHIVNNTFQFEDWTPSATAAAINLRRLDLLSGTTQCLGNHIDGNIFAGVPGGTALPKGIVEADSTKYTWGINRCDNVTTPVTYATSSGSYLGLAGDGLLQPYVSALAVGHSSTTDFTTPGFGIDSSGVIRHVVDSAALGRYNRTGSVGTIHQFFQDGVTVGSIQSLNAAVAAWFGVMKATVYTTAQLNAGTPDLAPQLNLLAYCSDGAYGSPCLARATASAWTNAFTNQPLVSTAADNQLFLRSDGVEKPTGSPKGVSVLNPAVNDKVTLFYTTTSMTLLELDAVLVGSSTPSVSWTIRYAADRSATGTEVVTGGTTTTTTTTAQATTSFNSATIAAGNFVWLSITAVSGTVNELAVSMKY